MKKKILPIGTGGRPSLFLSGGIDSPVAGYMMAKRGLVLNAIHFASPPYTSPQSEEKVHNLLRKVSRYSGNICLFTVGFTEIQEEIRDKCPEELFTLIMRRFMMRISNRIAEKEDCKALITGESLGQVASQTLNALACTDAVVNMPVFRPLIGLDKDEIIGAVDDIFSCAVIHTGNPKEGDYLNFVWKSWGSNISAMTNGRDLYLKIQYNVKYYTDAEKEKTLDGAVANLKKDLKNTKKNLELHLKVNLKVVLLEIVK